MSLVPTGSHSASPPDRSGFKNPSFAGGLTGPATKDRWAPVPTLFSSGPVDNTETRDLQGFQPVPGSGNRSGTGGGGGTGSHRAPYGRAPGVGTGSPFLRIRYVKVSCPGSEVLASLLAVMATPVAPSSQAKYARRRIGFYGCSLSGKGKVVRLELSYVPDWRSYPATVTLKCPACGHEHDAQPLWRKYVPRLDDGKEAHFL